MASAPRVLVATGYGVPVSTTPPEAQALAADPACVSPAAVKLALKAAQEVEGSARVGAHVGHTVDGERIVTHLFECLNIAYPGWQWAVTLVRADGAKDATVDEAVLLPGDGALLPPPWVPWSERIQPGDLGVGDLVVTPANDPRLVPGYTGEDESLPEELLDPLNPPAWEVGLGRERVLGSFGREEAAERWRDGDFGPRSPMAQAAPAQCSTCGFLIPVAGAMRGAFGVCANALAPSDGHIVAVDFGCGAHSEAAIEVAAETVEPLLIDEVDYERVDLSVDSDSEQ